jgi:hypothetical protein
LSCSADTEYIVKNNSTETGPLQAMALEHSRKSPLRRERGRVFDRCYKSNHIKGCCPCSVVKYRT